MKLIPSIKTGSLNLILLLIIIVVFQIDTCAQLENPQEKGVLYRIVKKTTTLKQNCLDCFSFTPPQLLDSLRNVNISMSTYDALEKHLISNPNCVTIDWTLLQNKTDGLISELAVKFTIYQLNEQLKKELNSGVKNLTFYNKLTPYLPETYRKKSNGKRAQKIIKTVTHPSLPVKKKTETLTTLSVSAKDQKLLMNRWTELLYDHISKKSAQFFKSIKGSEALFQLQMLAAGEGSGTAGLLNEYEAHPNDSSKTWYGKAAGMFTYEYIVKQSKTIPKENTFTQMQIPKNKDVAVHVCLWGLNSTQKPMVIFTINKKSYQLFAPNQLTPDMNQGKGLTQLDRIERLKIVKVEQPIEKLNEEGSLLTIIKKEYQLKDKIEYMIHEHELAIDSIRKQKPINTSLIDYHKNFINTYLTNLTSKETRIAELNNKIAAEYRKIENEKAKIKEMEDHLGENVQPWSKNKNIYTFSDGAMFNFDTQDFILPATNTKRELSIRLVSPSLILSGELKDEIQMFATVTETEIIRPIQQPVNRRFQFLFNTDDIIPTNLPVTYKAYIDTIRSYKNIVVKLDIDTSYISKKYFPEGKTSMDSMRLSTITTSSENDILTINITAGCDPVQTRLSFLHKTHRTKLGTLTYSIKHNKYLATLRVLSILKTMQLPDASINKDALLKWITTEELDLLEEIVNTNDTTLK